MALERAFFNVLCQDLAAAQAFYMQLFGLEIAFESDWFVHLHDPQRPALELGLLRADHELVPADARNPPAGAMLTLVVRDVDAIHSRACELAVTVVEAPRDRFYGQRRMLLRDPEGTLIDVSSACAADPEWLTRVEAREQGGHRER